MPPTEAVVAPPQPPSTTTISTIVVRAGENATIVVALLKSDGFVELRIDEMKPKLLQIGNSVEETSALLNIHEDIINRLRSKEDQVRALLSRADALGSEKPDPKEAVVYDAMAKSLHQAWRELNKQLMLRGYLLKETLSFHRMASHHKQLTTSISDHLRRLRAGDKDPEIQTKIDHLINNVIDTTVATVDSGSSAISQIRALGQLDDNIERPGEILNSCLAIETIMLNIVSEWEGIEEQWSEERSQLVSKKTTSVTETLVQIEEWLTMAERKVKALNEEGQRRILNEGNAHKAKLLELGASAGAEDGQHIVHLNGKIEEFLHYMKTRMNRSNRIQTFFQSANSMLSQLNMMEEDVRNANAAIAGELGPLARQKASSVIHEGKDISAKEILTHEEQRLVRQKVSQLENKLAELEELAKQRTQVDNIATQELYNLKEWMFKRVEPFLAQNGDMGGNLEEANQFVATHRTFAEEVLTRDASVASAISKKSEMKPADQEALSAFEKQYERVKDAVENRIQLGTTYEQVHRFARDLESSFEALTALLDTNRDFTNERVAAQMNNVFLMIQETMAQEKHQGEKFINSAEQVGLADKELNCRRAITAVRNIITDHEHRFTYVTGKWMEWQQNKAALKRVTTTVEEVQMWQEEAVEIIRLLNETDVKSKQESEEIQKKVEELRETIQHQKRKLDEARQLANTQELREKVAERYDKQLFIERQADELKKKVETVYETFLQEDMVEKIQAPKIVTELRDAQVDEGSRFEFAARVEGQPEPTISWLKDGIDIKNNIDYRQDYVNGVASLVIEETFIEDSALYTIRAANVAGVDESSARLTVKSRSAISSFAEEEKPRIAQQLRNVAVNEGERIHLECVVVGHPEPEVVWYKEETTVREDERKKFMFIGNRCGMIVEQAKLEDEGLYTIRARNIHGETASFCQVKVVPKKQPPPPTPPKPSSRPSSVMSRPPSIQAPLSTSTWTEGETATLQVYTTGEPRPQVQWLFNEQPLQVNTEVQVKEQADGWSRVIISPVRPVHAGLYTVVAENEAGETRSAATLHVAPSVTTTTTEHMMQQDMVEQIDLQPVARREETTKRTAHEISESDRMYHEIVDHDLQSIPSDKRWVEIIEEEMSRASSVLSPIPAAQESRKTTTTEQRWVDEIDELLGAPRTKKEEKEVRTAETYVRMVDELMRTPVVGRAEQRAGTPKEYVSQIHEAPQPDVRQSTTTPSAKMFNVATVWMSPQPETYTATTSSGAPTEHVAAVRQTPVPESHQATITKTSSVENIAAIRQTPVPESHQATITTSTVENIAAIRQTPVPESHQATTTQISGKESAAAIRQAPEAEQHVSTMTSVAPAVENIAAYQQTSAPEAHTTTISGPAKLASQARVHTPGPGPDRQSIERQEIKIDRVDDVLLQPLTKQSSGDVKQTVTSEGFITKTSQEFGRPEMITTVKKTVTEDESETGSRAEQRESTSASTVVHITTEQSDKDLKLVDQKVPQREQVTTTTKTQSGEGWVQEVHDEMGKPTQVTVRKYTGEEVASTDQKNLEMRRQPSGEHRHVEETKEEIEMRQKVRIPQPTVPVTTTTTTEEGAGWVKEVHDEVGKPTQTIVRTYKDEDLIGTETRGFEIKKPAVPVTTTTTTESGEGWVQEVHDEMGKPTQTTTRYYTEEERDIRDQQSRSHIPIAQTRTTTTTVQETADKKAASAQSRIPVRTEPVIKTEVSGEGWVKETHEQFGQPVTTTVRKYVDVEDAHSEVSARQRDSMIIASDVEGFWTDGAYTGSPTPPPVPPHRRVETLEKSAIGESRSSTEPEFIRTFRKDYTVDEGGELRIECVLVGNPRPKVRFYFNDLMLHSDSKFCKVEILGDTYSLTIKDAKLEHAGYYKITAENKKGFTESLTVVHVRPRSLPKAVQIKTKPEHTTVTEEFAMFEYEQRRPQKHESSRLVTPPPAKRLQQVHKRDEEHLEQYDIEDRRSTGHPPHFTQTLVSLVAAEGDAARFEGIVTGWPAPTVEWSKDGVPFNRDALPGLQISNIGGRVALIFEKCGLEHSGKYMCTAKNTGGVATSSAQLVVRPKTIAPDFIQRLISEEVVEGEQLKWSVRVTGDPKPKITWLRDGIEIPNCEEVRLADEGNGVYSLIIVRVEVADSGQFTCLAENVAGEARSTADLVVRSEGAAPGNYFHVTKVTQEKQAKGEEPVRSSAFSIENPKPSDFL